MKVENKALSLFQELLAVPSPSGREERMAGIIGEKLRQMGYTYESDGAGNIAVRLEGQKPLGLLVLAAHMDEVALVVTGIGSDGTLRIDRSGGLYPGKIGEGPVDIIGDGEILSGILSLGSMHRPDPMAQPLTWADYQIITGFAPTELIERGVRVGSSCVPPPYRRGPELIGPREDPLVAAWTFDDRMGVVALLRLLETFKQKGIKPVRPTLIGFTVHEEGGCHGAKVLAAREQPEVFVAVDGCPIPPGVDLFLDGRPGIWSMDKLTHFDQGLVQAFCRAAREAGTELQIAAYPSGAFSDASAVYNTGGAHRVATVGHVRENSHGYEVARLSVFDNLLRTLLQFTTTWC